ncbi:hypothetical protein PBS_34750 [Paraburkholderia sp. 2C]
MANDSTNGVLRPGAFSLSWSGGLQYGSREMSFDGVDRFYFAKGDTINDDTQTGVGVFVLRLQNHDLEELKEVARTLCDNDIQTGGPETYDPPSTFNVVCMGDGKVVSTSGSQRLIPEKFWSRVFDAPFRLSEEAWENGQKLIKLDFKTESIERKNGSYIVSVRFINSGERWIKFKTPDQWGGDTVRGTLGVAPFSKIGKIEPRDDWGFELAGKKLINQGDFPDGVVLLNPGDSRKLVFSATPDNKIAKGGYNLSGAAFMRIEYEGNGWGLSTKVDFRPIGNSIAFDHDYPSTPEEREQWERTHRENMSQRPVKPGQTFVEAGLYRAVRTSGASRGLLLKPFKAGDVATTEPVTMPMDSEYAAGTNISGPVHWVWEASAPTPVKQWSFDIIEDTAQFCEPGVACPRSGRWVPRVMIGSGFGVEEYQYRLAGIVTLRRGETMPSIEGSGPRWEWVGVSNG